jgi:bifunctional UDP-N-acetylglucosamine pyrophosphorylase/glucosamine-1-phosphate N-acetyltransferase
MTQVVVLAAGKGKRMGAAVPKVLCEVGGRPMVGRLIDSILASGVTKRPLVVIGYGTEIIKKYLGIKCNYVLQTEQLGTAHAVSCTKDYLAGVDDVLVLYGDHPFLTLKTISDLASTHKQSSAVLTMMTLRLPSFDGWYKIFEDWGRIIRDKDDKVAAIIEKKDATPEQLAIAEVNPSFFCFKTDWLWENLPRLDCNNAQGEFYLTDLVHLAISQNKKVHVFPVTNAAEAVGVNTPAQLELAQNLFMRME